MRTKEMHLHGMHCIAIVCSSDENIVALFSLQERELATALGGDPAKVSAMRAGKLRLFQAKRAQGLAGAEQLAAQLLARAVAIGNAVGENDDAVVGGRRLLTALRVSVGRDRLCEYLHGVKDPADPADARPIEEFVDFLAPATTAN